MASEGQAKIYLRESALAIRRTAGGNIYDTNSVTVEEVMEELRRMEKKNV